MSNAKPSSADVVIIGGGVIGLSIARSLALRGIRDILLLERGGLSLESSSAAAGMLAPQAEADQADLLFDFTCRSRDMYPEFAATLRDETGIDVELDTTGTLYLAFTDDEAYELQTRCEWQTSAGLEVQRLTPEDAKTFEPCIAPNVTAALRFPRDIQVENRRLLAALATANELLDVKLETGTIVRSVATRSGKISGVETSGGFIAAASVVVAAGAWCSDLKVNGSGSLPAILVEPVRGQMLCFETNPRMCEHVIYSHGGYLVPRRDGRLLAGSTTEHAGFEKRVTAAGVHRILTAALQISPDVKSLRLLDTWAGLRPRAADGLPVIGPYAEIDGLFYATGHYRNGILLAPITAELIAAAIVSHEVSPLLDSFSPNRFDLVSTFGSGAQSRA